MGMIWAALILLRRLGIANALLPGFERTPDDFRIMTKR